MLLALLCLDPSGAVFAEPLRLAAVQGSSDVNFGVAVVKEAYARLGHEIEIVSESGPTALKRSNGGDLDGEVQRIDGISRDFENLIPFQVPVNYLQYVAFAKTDALLANHWHNLRPYKLGIVRGILFAEQGTHGMDVTRYGTYDDRIGMTTVDVAQGPKRKILAVAARQLGEIIKTRQELLGERSKLHSALEKRSSDARITVHEHVYTGVDVRIGDQNLKVTTDIECAEFFVRNDVLTHQPVG
tara:strand:+ start:7160 stop:7888 length:729 start_codon:yes stop_codon:yes gene_type:complete